MNCISKAIILLTVILITNGCVKEKEYRADVKVRNLEFSQSIHSETIDIPNGTIIQSSTMPDVRNPSAWTGEWAQYVKHIYAYSVRFDVTNRGNLTAHDTEIDLHLTFDNDDEEVVTIIVGELKPKRSVAYAESVFSTNKQLIACEWEAYWFE